MGDPSELGYLTSKLGFSLAELELNRAGQLSSEQNWTALRSGVSSFGMMLAAVGVLLVILGFRSSGMLRVVWYVFLIPGSGVVFYFFCLMFLGAVQRRVVTAEGTVDFRGGSRGPPSLLIGKASVSAPPNASEVLTSSRRYRLYYLAKIDQFLSIEPL
jgi:hypothetical protein